MIYPAILSGGSGTRLWPMSRSQYPKQLLGLFGDRGSLLQQTVLRVADDQRFAPSLIVANEDRFIVAEQLRDDRRGPPPPSRSRYERSRCT